MVNHLGHFILVNQLMAAVTAAPRVALSSSAARPPRAPSDGIRFDDLAFANSDYDAWTACSPPSWPTRCARELARRLSGTSTTDNGVHPGVINTNLGRHMPWYMQWGGKLFGWAFMKSIEEGAATQTYVATSQAWQCGFYFVDCNPAPGDTRRCRTTPWPAGCGGSRRTHPALPA